MASPDRMRGRYFREFGRAAIGQHRSGQVAGADDAAQGRPDARHLGDQHAVGRGWQAVAAVPFRQHAAQRGRSRAWRAAFLRHHVALGLVAVDDGRDFRVQVAAQRRSSNSVWVESSEKSMMFPVVSRSARAPRPGRRAVRPAAPRPVRRRRPRQVEFQFVQRVAMLPGEVGHPQDQRLQRGEIGGAWPRTPSGISTWRISRVSARASLGRERDHAVRHVAQGLD